MPKKRTSAQKTGNRGLTAIRQYCDAENLIYQGEPCEDYGVDCYINVRNGSLAAYVRRLVYSTPNTRDRVAIFSSTMTCIVDGRSTMVSPSDTVAIANFFGADLPQYTSVIGYSSDDHGFSYERLSIVVDFHPRYTPYFSIPWIGGLSVFLLRSIRKML